MTSAEQATALALDYLHNETRKPCVAISTEERLWGWVVVTRTEEYVRPQDRRFTIPGHGPLAVLLELKKIDDGTFGICEICEEPIGKKRLKARPETTLCIKCKEDQEREERTMG